MKQNTSKYHLDGVPPLKEAFLLGLQHFIAMIAGNMVPAILIANIVGLNQSQSTMLMQGSMLAAGISTLLQLYPIKITNRYKIGARLPLIMGTNYMFLGACLSVVSKYGIDAMIGAQIGGAIVLFISAFFIKKIKPLFTPVISGTIITCIGISLIETSINNLAGGVGSSNFGKPINFFIGISVILIIVILMKYGKGMFKDAAILVGITVGYIVCLSFGMVDFSVIYETKLIEIPNLLAFGIEFRVELILLFAVINLISIAGILGSMSVLTFGVMDRDVSDKELETSIMACSVGSILSSVFSSIPMVVFSQSAAMIAIDKVISRFVIAITSIILLTIGVSPFLCALMTTIPHSVIGGVTIIVFSSIAMSGINIMTVKELTEEDKLMSGISIMLGIGFTSNQEAISQLPDMIQILIGDSCVVPMFISFMILKFILNRKNKILCDSK